MGEANQGTEIPNEHNVTISEGFSEEGQGDLGEGQGTSGEGEAGGEQTFTVTEEKAVARGWRPEEEWSGDPDAWVDARNYVQHGELMDEISKQKKANKALSKTMNKFTKMQGDIQKKAIEVAKADLLADKEEALINQDMAAVVQIDEDIKANDKALEEANVEPVAEGQSHAEEFDQYFAETWKSDNGWYETNDVMHMYADQIGIQLYDANPDLNPSEIFNKLDNIMKDKFPQEFENQQRRKPAAVGSVQTGGRNGGGSTVNKAVSNLNEHEIKIGNEYVKAGYFKDLAEYAAELEKA